MVKKDSTEKEARKASREEGRELIMKMSREVSQAQGSGGTKPRMEKSSCEEVYVARADERRRERRR